MQFRFGFVARFNQFQCNHLTQKIDCKQNAIGQNSMRNDAEHARKEIKCVCGPNWTGTHTHTQTYEINNHNQQLCYINQHYYKFIQHITKHNLL